MAAGCLCYSAALPQILQKSGIPYFMTTKIGWNEFNRFPHDTFLWKGIDGTEVLTHLISTRNYQKPGDLKMVGNHSTTYNGLQNASRLMGTWQRYQDKDVSTEVLTCYGYGDGGGGPTEEIFGAEQKAGAQHRGMSCSKTDRGEGILSYSGRQNGQKASGGMGW